MHADIRAIVPIAIGIVAAVEAASDNLLEAVPGLIEIEVDEEARAQANDALVSESDKIAFGEKAAMVEKMLLAHQLVLAERGEAIALQLLKR